MSIENPNSTDNSEHTDSSTEDVAGTVIPWPRPTSEPTEPGKALVADEAIDAEIVSESAGPDNRRPGTALVPVRPVWTRTVQAARVVRTVVTHERTKITGRAVVRQVAYPAAGAVVAVRRWRDAHGASRYERQMRAAELGGDQEALRYWQEADVAEKQRRHQRVMDWISAPGQLIRACVLGLAGLAGFLLLVGMLVWANTGDITDVIGPITAVVSAVAFVVWFLATYGAVLLLAATASGVAYLHHLGRTRTELPPWLSAPADLDSDAMDELPDEGTIVNALRNLDISGFNRALKEGWRLRFLMPPTIDGKGWRTQIALPPASPVVEIVKRKTTLAHNLMRFPIEVWPTEPQPSVLDLWVANPGALSGPVDPWPLLADLDNAQVDYFTGVPVAVTIRGDVIRGRLFEANYGFGGVMGSGKSTMAITLVSGAMLDPLVDIDVVVMAENADYEPMRPRLRSLSTGAGDDTVNTCMTLLANLHEELSLRGQALKQHGEHGERAVTRAIAEKDERLRPRIVVVDECQNLFMGKHGKTAIETATKLVFTARKYAITLMFLTPEPSKDALPRKLMSVISNKACFAIGDHQANDAVLGTGSYKAGISAVGLLPKTDEGDGDVGTCMARGFMAKPGLLRSFYLSQHDVHRVTARAMQLRAQHGVAPMDVDVVEPARDPLTDIATVLGDLPRMKTLDVLQRLIERHRRNYQDWNPRTLTTYLTEHQAAPYKTEGAMHVSAARIREALTTRDENPGDDNDSEQGAD